MKELIIQTNIWDVEFARFLMDEISREYGKLEDYQDLRQCAEKIAEYSKDNWKKWKKIAIKSNYRIGCAPDFYSEWFQSKIGNDPWAIRGIQDIISDVIINLREQKGLIMDPEWRSWLGEITTAAHDYKWVISYPDVPEGSTILKYPGETVKEWSERIENQRS